MIWLVLLVLFAVWAYTKINSCLQVLQKRGVKCQKPLFLFGNSLQSIIGNETMVDMIVGNYNAFPNSRYCGMYMMVVPRITIRDPELIRKITVADFDHFVDHTPFLSNDREPLWTRNLLSLRGERWREMRSTLSPSFTSSKMRSMFVLMSECAEQLVEYLQTADEDLQVLELKGVFTRVANDVIATCAFGIQVDSLRDKENEFYLMGKEATNFSGFWKNLRLSILFGTPLLAQFLGISMFTKPVHRFFRSLVSETVKGREEGGIVRPDMIQMLVDAKKGGNPLSSDDQEAQSVDTGFATVEEYSKGKIQKAAKDITLDDMTAQALLFFFAGFDTVSALLCFACYELALNTDVQERLRREVVETAEKVTYDSLNRMKYLDMVVSETLRKWPAMIALDRMCVSEYTIPAESDDEVDLVIEKDESIGVSIYGIHRDPKYYPEPEKFDPERFSDENKYKIKPYTYLPFGAGPRNCIGSRFALLEVKVMLVHLLSRFEIVPVEKTSIPLKIFTSGPNLNSVDGFWLGLKKV